MRAKQTKFIRMVIVAITMMIQSTMLLTAQSDENALPCLQKEYQSTAEKVLLDCVPQEAKSINGEVSWMVVSIDKKGRPQKIIENAIEKEGRSYFLVPKNIFKKHPNEEVMLIYNVSDGNKGFSYRYKLKVTL